MRVALLQMTSSDDPEENCATLVSATEEAARGGAEMIMTPEVSNCVSASRTRQSEVLRREEEDATLAAMQEAAARAGIWVLIGSLALKTEEERFANRSFLIDGAGEIRARYDKMHMFDVTLSETESYRESAGYRPGSAAVMAATPWGKIGLTICYDLRFPGLYRAYAQAGATILTVPSAFSVPTGRAHWHTLLRARAIENGAFVLAPAQTGTHKASRGKARRTYGHSLAVGPWGEVFQDAGEERGLTFAELDLTQVDEARRKIPSLTHDRAYSGP
ncbi:MAG: carbon-nitrogen hydrolase family protein [Pseudomonadota bacterium]